MSLPKPYITFAVPSYNSASYLRVALESLVGFGDTIEVLVIDDGSTDETLAIAREYEEKYPYFHAIHQENKGHGGAINTAISLAKGQYFKVLDSDDWVKKESLKALLEDIENCDDYPDLYVTDYTYWQGYEKEDKLISYHKRVEQHKTVPIGKVKQLTLKENFTLHSTMFRLQLLKDENIVLPEHCSYEDNYFVYVALCRAQTMRYIHASLYQYLIGREGQSMSKENLFSKWSHILLISEKVYMHMDITTLKKTDKGKYRLLRHHLSLFVAMTPLICQINGTDEACNQMREFFVRCKETYPKQYKIIKHHPIISYMRIPGSFGKGLTRATFKVIQSVVRIS